MRFITVIVAVQKGKTESLQHMIFRLEYTHAPRTKLWLRSSSTVEHLAVNEVVTGSNPVSGAKSWCVVY